MVVGQFEHSPTVSVGKSGCRNFKLSHHLTNLSMSGGSHYTIPASAMMGEMFMICSMCIHRSAPIISYYGSQAVQTAGHSGAGKR